MPPIPTTGMRTLRARAQTIASATGLIAGPDRPPVTLRSRGRRVATSTARPRSVLMAQSASAPSASTARPTAVMSVTFGDSFTHSGMRTRRRTACTIAASGDGIGGDDAAPLRTIRARGVQLERDQPGRLVEARARTRRTPRGCRPRSSPPPGRRAAPAPAAARAGTRRRRRSGARSRSACRPGSRPAAAAAFPGRARATGPSPRSRPTAERSTRPANSSPYPNVPEAAITGVGRLTAPMVTRVSTASGHARPGAAP